MLQNLPVEEKKISPLDFISFLSLLLIIICTLAAFGTKNFNIGKKAFDLNNTVIPLSSKTPIYKLTASGTATLNKDNSYLRLILVDNKGVEYLVYETSSILTGQKIVSITDSCDETCLLPGIIPVSLKIDRYESDFKLGKTNMVNNLAKASPDVSLETIELERAKILKEHELAKISAINQQVKIKGLGWVAGETSVSKLTYAQKKKLFSNPDGKPVDKLPNLQGFEYYKGGIFKISGGGGGGELSPNLPESWDWRNVHGENWLTDVKDQGFCGSCWAFAGVAAEEAAINLYYNQLANFNLSEQEAVSCISESFGCSGGFHADVHDYATRQGISDENCFAYQGTNLNCYDKCADSEERKIFASGKEQSWTNSETILKQLLINRGVISISIPSMGHAMALVGYNGKSDWKLVEKCNLPLKYCQPGRGCLPDSCLTLNEEIAVCGSNFNNPGQVQTGQKFSFVCRMSKYGDLRWQYTGMEYCPGIDVCLNNVCKPRSEVSFNKGDTECSYEYNYFENYPVNSFYWQYLPGEGENYWIFKNSWGTNWGENGYGRLAIHMSDIGGYSLPKAPFIFPENRTYWPTGFDNQIKCVDKDNDKYCNWGISEAKPSTCPAFCKPQKDCNDSNSNFGPFDEDLSCVRLGSPLLPPSSCSLSKPSCKPGFSCKCSVRTEEGNKGGCFCVRNKAE